MQIKSHRYRYPDGENPEESGKNPKKSDRSKSDRSLIPLPLPLLPVPPLPPTLLVALLTSMLVALLVGFPCRCQALPVWPISAAPDGKPVEEDRIGYEDGSNAEFIDHNSPVPSAIEYTVGEAWSNFPHRLNAKNRTSPHTVNIMFETCTGVAARNLILAARTDTLLSQRLGAFLDGHPVHPDGGEEIQPGSTFKEHTFWLGSLSKGEHIISISNISDDAPDSLNPGILFDYLKLVAADRIGFSLNTIPEGVADPNVVMSVDLIADPNSMPWPDPPPGLNFYYGFWKLRISGLDRGGKAEIEIHCPAESFFCLQEYYAYDPVQQDWRAVAVKKDSSRSMITLDLSDGSTGDLSDGRSGDEDPSQDGSILHIGGIAIPFSLRKGYGYNGCFISSL